MEVPIHHGKRFGFHSETTGVRALRGVESWMQGVAHDVLVFKSQFCCIYSSKHLLDIYCILDPGATAVNKN